jgi:hypothetical protein
VVKLSRPHRSEPWRQISIREAPEDSFGELERSFSETIAQDLDDTVRNLRTLGEPAQAFDPAVRASTSQAVYMLIEEVRELRAAQAKTISEVSRKASSTAVAKDIAAIGSHLDKRVDSIRSVAMWAIGIQFLLIMFILGKLYGH